MTLDRYIGECMVPIINIKKWYERTYHGYQNCNTSQILIFSGYIKVRESLYTRVFNWVNTILNHIDISTILPRYEGPCIVYIYPNGI